MLGLGSLGVLIVIYVAINEITNAINESRQPPESDREEFYNDYPPIEPKD